jgi:hypothetical protein
LHDSNNLEDIFGNLQLAVGARGGSERAVRSSQAAVELDPSNHIALYADCTNDFNSCDRAKMLTSVYSDDRLSNMWGVFAFSYSAP